MSAAYRYVEPAGVEEAVALLAEHGDEAHLIAGGTALAVLLDQGLVRPSVLVGLRPWDGLAALSGIEPSADGGLRIGALTPIRAVERSPLVAARVPALAEAAARVASVRVRNQATLGGHVAHADPAQDIPPALLALDATVEAVGPTGPRSIPVAELAVDVFETTLAHDELVSAIVLPPPPGPRSRLVTFAFRPRSVEDYPTVAVAVRLELDPAGAVTGARIALGCVAATTVRARAAEAALIGVAPDARLVADAAALVDEVLDPVDDDRGSAAYKRAMARLWTRRALERAVQQPIAPAASPGAAA